MPMQYRGPSLRDDGEKQVRRGIALNCIVLNGKGDLFCRESLTTRVPTAE